MATERESRGGKEFASEDVTQDRRFAALIEQRAKRLGVTIDEAKRSLTGRVRLVDATAEIAARNHRDANEMVRASLERMRTSDYPTELCIRVQDVETFAEAGMTPPAVQAHLETCPSCKVMMDFGKPDPSRTREFMHAVDEVDGLFRALSNGATTDPPQTKRPTPSPPPAVKSGPPSGPSDSRR